MTRPKMPPFPWRRLLVKSVSGTWHVCHTAEVDDDKARTNCTRLIKVAKYADPYVPPGFNPMKVCCDCDWKYPNHLNPLPIYPPFS